jgi:hypothetical protein
LTQNTHPAGDKTGCDHGTFVSICCKGFRLAANTCAPTAFGSIFSGGTAGSSSNSLGFSLKILGLGKRATEGEELIASMEGLTIDNQQPSNNTLKEASEEKRKDKRASGSGAGYGYNHQLCDHIAN